MEGGAEMKRDIYKAIAEGEKLLNERKGYELKFSEWEMLNKELIEKGSFRAIISIFQCGVAIGYRLAKKHR